MVGNFVVGECDLGSDDVRIILDELLELSWLF